MWRSRQPLILLLASVLWIDGCVEKDKSGKTLDNPTQGNISIAVDESLRPLLEAEVDTFHGHYHYAKINTIYTSEAEAMDLLLKDSVRVAVVTRKLNAFEHQHFTDEKIFPDEVKVARDGVSLILNRSNPDSVLLFTQLQSIVDGSISKWNQISKSNTLGGIEVVFDNPKSGIIRFMNDSVKHVEKLPPYFYGVESNSAVIDYVAKKPNAIGLIGACWISDHDDVAVRRFLHTIRVARLGKNDERPVQPYQAYVSNGQYPLTRDVYMISREYRTGLGTGLISFVAGDKGQRIVLKTGMVPATMPVRLIEIHGVH